MRRFVLPLLLLCLSSAGCHCCSRSCYWYNCKDPCKADDDCYCMTDGSESPRYRPPGPFWTRPDSGCEHKCRRYQLWKESVCEDAKSSVNWMYPVDESQYCEEVDCER